MTETLSVLGILLTIATGTILLRVYRHPMKWWVRRQQRLAIAEQIRLQQEAFARFSLAMGDLAAAMANALVPALTAARQAVDQLHRALNESTNDERKN